MAKNNVTPRRRSYGKVEGNESLRSIRDNSKRKSVDEAEELTDTIKNSGKRRKAESSVEATWKKQQQVSGRKASEKKNVGSGVGDEQQKWCHQCRRSNKGRVVRCKKCQTKNFCTICLTKWYPGVSEEQFAKACPVCCGNCNCKACLRGFLPKDMQWYSCSEHDKVQYSKYLLQRILPLLKRVNEEHLMEKEIEAKVKGLSLLEIKLQDAECEVDEVFFCDNCGIHLFDFYRSCGHCGYDLCLACCQELRDGNVLGGKGMSSDWKSHEDGSIPCPPKDAGGCGDGTLELKRMMPVDCLPDLLEKAQGVIGINGTDDILQTSLECTLCYDSDNEASSNATYIQPGDTEHFQFHWLKGTPIVVRDVLSATSGLSWEPTVLWRAFRDIKSYNHLKNVNAINCLYWSEVTVDLYQFCRGYWEGRFDKEGWPLILKLENWRPSYFSKEQLPRHFVELINSLPFKDYTHPQNGYLNVAIKLPDLSAKPDMGPKMDIAYGLKEELEYGDSVTKLHYDKSDTVNVLTHATSVDLTSAQIKKIEALKKKRTTLDQRRGCPEAPQTNNQLPHAADLMDGGALWDIFERQDVPKLEEYLRNYSAEFRYTGCLPVQQVVHPIHDRAFYLTMDHKKKLKEQFGIEPRTFIQKLGDAVLIPAGCPYQVRNLKSCTNVVLNFVSPESLGECIRLQQEIRLLPRNHLAKEEQLNIGKMMLYALENAISELAGVIAASGPNADIQLLNLHGSSLGCDENGDSDEDPSEASTGGCSLNGFTENFDAEKGKEIQLAASSMSGGLRISSTPDGSMSDGGNPTMEHGPAVEDDGTSMEIIVSKALPEAADDETVGVWRGLAVGVEARQLLQAVESRYPNTFQGVQTRSEAIWLTILKEFCTVIKRFMETSVDELVEEQVKSLQEDLHEFERFGFDLSWANERLKMVEDLKFGTRPSVQELVTLDESLKTLKKTLVQRREELKKAVDALGEARFEYENAKTAREEKALEICARFGADYDNVLKGHLGSGILPGY